MKRLILLFVIATTAVQCHKDTTTSNGYADIAAANNLGIGKSAHDLLSADGYQTLNIEIQYMPGMQLQAGSVTSLLAFLNSHLNKPGGIHITETQVASIGKDPITLQEASVYEKDNRTAYTAAGAIGFYILVVDADYSNGDVIGAAYRNTSIVLFGKTIQDNTGGPGEVSTEKIETGVLEHEFGHTLGLVNYGSPMVVNHEDPNSKGHCVNPDCLMYYQAENGLVDDSSNNIAVLDTNCLNDLKANGGK